MTVAHLRLCEFALLYGEPLENQPNVYDGGLDESIL
jgi:hypothetical protein